MNLTEKGYFKVFSKYSNTVFSSSIFKVFTYNFVFFPSNTFQPFRRLKFFTQLLTISYNYHLYLFLVYFLKHLKIHVLPKLNLKDLGKEWIFFRVEKNNMKTIYNNKSDKLFCLNVFVLLR